MKISKIIAVMVGFLISQTISAETYKCLKNGRTTYQEKPCGDNPEIGKIKVKESTPEEKAEALAKLQAIQAERDARKASAEQQEKEQYEAKLKGATVSAMQDGAEAQRRQAEAQEEQARKPAVTIAPPQSAPVK